jgi:hypothetical protein
MVSQSLARLNYDDIQGTAKAKLSENIVELGKRTQAILFLRECMYRLTEASITSGLDKTEVAKLYGQVLQVAAELAKAEVDESQAELIRARQSMEPHLMVVLDRFEIKSGPCDNEGDLKLTFSATPVSRVGKSGTRVGPYVFVRHYKTGGKGQDTKPFDDGAQFRVPLDIDTDKVVLRLESVEVGTDSHDPNTALEVSPFLDSRREIVRFQFPAKGADPPPIWIADVFVRTERREGG